ncbi:IS3 family transposase [Staphylococcus xylosus]
MLWRRFDHFYQLEQANQNYMIFYNNERIKSKFKGLSTKKLKKQTFEILH